MSDREAHTLIRALESLQGEMARLTQRVSILTTVAVLEAIGLIACALALAQLWGVVATTP